LQQVQVYAGQGEIGPSFDEFGTSVVPQDPVRPVVKLVMIRPGEGEEVVEELREGGFDGGHDELLVSGQWPGIEVDDRGRG